MQIFQGGGVGISHVSNFDSFSFLFISFSFCSSQIAFYAILAPLFRQQVNVNINGGGFFPAENIRKKQAEKGRKCTQKRDENGEQIVLVTYQWNNLDVLHLRSQDTSTQPRVKTLK
jgi:hypothetical protein